MIWVVGSGAGEWFESREIIGKYLNFNNREVFRRLVFVFVNFKLFYNIQKFSFVNIKRNLQITVDIYM